MKRIVLSFFLFFLFSFCLGQNTSAGKYVSNPESALADARKALSNGNYKEAEKLARLYNALTDSRKGDDVILSAEREILRHGEYDSLMESGEGKQRAGKHAEAVLDFLSAYNIIPEDKRSSEAILKCAKDALSKKGNIKTHLTAAEKLWEFSSTQNDQTAAEYAAHLGSETAVRTLYNAALAKDDLTRAQTIAKLAIRDSVAIRLITKVGDLFVDKAKKSSMTYSVRRREYQNAASCYTVAAEKGNAEAMYKLADLYSNVSYVKDLDKALEYCQKARNSGSRQADALLPSIRADISKRDEERKKAPFKHFLNNFDARDTGNVGLSYTFSKYSGALSLYGNINYISFRITTGTSDTPFVYECSSIKGSTAEYRWYKPTTHFLFAPGLFFNYFSIDFGLGGMFTSKVSAELPPATSSETHTTVFVGEKDKKEKEIIKRDTPNMPITHFMMQPRLTIHVPIYYEQFAITAHAGYIFVPDLKEMCSFIWGLGFTFNL